MDACQRAMEHLTASGILTYKPGVATGKCRAPYVVVEEAAHTRAVCPARRESAIGR